MSADFSDEHQNDSPSLVTTDGAPDEKSLSYFQSLLGMIVFVVRTRQDIASRLIVLLFVLQKLLKKISRHSDVLHPIFMVHVIGNWCTPKDQEALIYMPIPMRHL